MMKSFVTYVSLGKSNMNRVVLYRFQMFILRCKVDEKIDPLFLNAIGN